MNYEHEKNTTLEFDHKLARNREIATEDVLKGMKEPSQLKAFATVKWPDCFPLPFEILPMKLL